MANLLLHTSRLVHLIYEPPRKSCKLRMFQDRPGRVHAPWDNVPALVATMVGRHLAHPEKRIEGEQACNLIEAKAHDAE